MITMKLTKQWLKKHNACSEAYKAFCAQQETDVIELLKKCIKENHKDWANWLIVRKMTYRQYVSYAVFAAEQVIGLYEKQYPNDNRPRKSIEAAKACIKKASKKNKAAAWAAWAAAKDAVFQEMQRKILNYGINLIESKNRRTYAWV